MHVVVFVYLQTGIVVTRVGIGWSRASSPRTMYILKNLWWRRLQGECFDVIYDNRVCNEVLNFIYTWIRNIENILFIPETLYLSPWHNCRKINFVFSIAFVLVPHKVESRHCTN